MSEQPGMMIKQDPELKQKKLSTHITIYTNRNIIKADAHSFPKMRLTDLLNGSEGFIPLTNAIIYDLESQEEITRTSFVSINKGVISMIFEE
ncbi:MAG: hypothetical protein ABSC17_00215 [Thermacetogeniaceae bacterium]